MPPRRRAELIVAMPNHGQAQINFDTPMDESVLSKAWQMTSDSYPAVDREIDRIMNCTLERLVQKEMLRRIMRFNMDFEASGLLMGQILAYQMGAAATPVGLPINQIQTITMTGTAGEWKVGIPVGLYVKYTSLLAWNATAAQLKAAIENLVAIGRGNTTVTLVAGVYTIEFVGNLAGAQMNQFVTDSTLLTGGTATQAQTQAGVQYSHALSEITGFQPPAYSFVVGYKNSSRAPRLYKSVVQDSFRISGSHAAPRLTANTAVAGSGELEDCSSDYVLPPCQVYRPIRFKDIILKIDGVDYTNQAANGNRLMDFELTQSNNLVTDDDAYTGQDEDVHRLERADERPYVLNLGILGEKGDVIYDLAEEMAEVPISLQIGRTNDAIIYTLPKASVSLRNPETVFDGSAKRTKCQIMVEPEETPTTWWTAEARIAESQTLLTPA